MLEDIAETLTLYEKESTAAQCEAVIHHLDNSVRYARELMERAHAILERRITEERQIAISNREPNFPTAQKIGVQ